MAEAVADGLADVDEGTGDPLELLADLGEDFLAVATAGDELDVEFVDGNGHDVVVAFGTSGTATDGFDFGDLQQQLDGPFSDFIRLLQRTAGRAGE